MSFSDLSDTIRGLDLTSASDQSAMPFELQAGVLVSGELKVRRITGRERVSECYQFDIDVASNVDPLTLKQGILGQPATLIMRNPPGSSRSVLGVIVSLRECGPLRHHSRHFRVRLVPTLWLLRRRRNTRIFQDLTVVEVVTAILKEAGIAHRWSVERRYEPRDYRVQYRETDYEFVVRLLREEGIFFFFDTIGSVPAADATNEREMIVFLDVARGYPTIESPVSNLQDRLTEVVDAALGAIGLAGSPGSSPSLSFRPGQGFAASDDTGIPTFDLERRLRSKKVTVHDYDFRHPLLDLTASVSALMPGAVGSDEETAALFDPEKLEIYEHHGEYETANVQQRSAQILLESYRVDAHHGEGTSACRRLLPGHRFTLDDHPDGAFNREFVVTEIFHTGEVPQNLADDTTAATRPVRPIYENRFKCLASSIAARPRAQPHQIQQVIEVATVVGPANEEIYTDQYGRIKVQFPWDRHGKRDERSSCWIRVSQAWSGAAWGAQFVPRIGMEVIVTFLGGDVDRPIVTGCLYNAIHPTPFELPGDKTRSGWRTQSTPGGGGFNELSFEDKQGGEQVYLHAQRDLDEEVERNHTSKIGNDEINFVARNQSDAVGGNRERVTSGNETVLVVMDQSLRVKGNRTDVVEGSRDSSVEKDLSTRIGGRERREVTDFAESAYRDDRMIRVRGSLTTLVGRRQAKRAYALHVEGVAQIAGTTAVEISSEKAIVLRCGASTLRLTPTGIEINAPAVHVIGKDANMSVSDKLRMGTKGEATVIAKKILLKSSDSSVALGKDAQIAGTKVLLNSPASATDPPPETPPEPTCIELVDQNGKPVPNQRYIATYDDGTVLGGITDKDGKATLVLDESGTIVFPDVSETKKS